MDSAARREPDRRDGLHASRGHQGRSKRRLWRRRDELQRRERGVLRSERTPRTARQPNYGFTWSNGVATNTSVTDYKAETTKLTVKDGTISADSSSFTVAPGSLNSLAFTTQPDAWEPRAPGSFPVAVTAEDTWGNGAPDQTITLTIDPAHNPGGATLTCDPASCQAGTDASGVASFNVSLDKDGLGYELQATTGTLQANSDPFRIGDVQRCTGNNCLLNGNADGSSTSASVSGASGDLLALGFDGSIQTASGQCGGAEQIGPGFEFVQAEKGGPSSAPVWTITATLSKNTEGFDASRGVAQWNICLGTDKHRPGSWYVPRRCLLLRIADRLLLAREDRVCGLGSRHGDVLGRHPRRRAEPEEV